MTTFFLMIASNLDKAPDGSHARYICIIIEKEAPKLHTMINLLDFPYNLIGTLDEPMFMPLHQVPDSKEEGLESPKTVVVQVSNFTQEAGSSG